MENQDKQVKKDKMHEKKKSAFKTIIHDSHEIVLLIVAAMIMGHAHLPSATEHSKALGTVHVVYK